MDYEHDDIDVDIRRGDGVYGDVASSSSSSSIILECKDGNDIDDINVDRRASSSSLPVTPDSVVGIEISNSTSTSPLSISTTTTTTHRAAGDFVGTTSDPPRSSSRAHRDDGEGDVIDVDDDNEDGDDDGASPMRLREMLRAECRIEYRIAPDYLHSSVFLPHDHQHSDHRHQHPAYASHAPSHSSSTNRHRRQAPASSSGDMCVTERCRRRTCEWMYDICDYFGLKREVVGIALHYVDRYFTLSFACDGNGGDDASGECDCIRREPATRRKFQLVALTGLYVAVKLHGECREVHHPQNGDRCVGVGVGVVGVGERDGNGNDNIDVDQQRRRQTNNANGNSLPWCRHRFGLSVCASISRNQFEPNEIERCELELLDRLDWHLNPVVSSGTIIDTLLSFLPKSSSSSSSSSYSSIPIDPTARRVGHTADDCAACNGTVGRATMNQDDDDDGPSLYVSDCAKYLAELSVSVPALCLVYWPSVVSYASILCAIDSLDRRSAACDATAATAAGRSSSSSTPPSPSSERTRRKVYEMRVRRATMGHFDREGMNVSGATRILRAICPNLDDLFHLPASLTPSSTNTTTIDEEPMSPTSIKL